jgi:hypothetical protein
MDRFTLHAQNLAALLSVHWNEAHGLIHFVAAVFGVHCH